jgi:F0F1-type ATP synthase epsilon subunit
MMYLLLCCYLLHGCHSAKQYNQGRYRCHARMNTTLYQNHPINEYVNRVGKILLTVNYDNHVINNAIINFGINNNKNPLLQIEYPLPHERKQNYSTKNQYNIVISKGLLACLQDEAELATVLAIAIEKISTETARVQTELANEFNSSNLSQQLHSDSRIITTLYKAGYDPTAFVALQAEFLVNQTNHHTRLKKNVGLKQSSNFKKYPSLKQQFLNNLFYQANISDERVNINQKMLSLLPKGLKRCKETYLKNINLLEQLN